MKYGVNDFLKVILTIVIGFSLMSCGGAEDRKEVYIEKAKQLIKNKNFDKATVEIKNALQIDPKNPESYYLMGQINYSKRDLAGSINNYKKAIGLKADYSDAKISLAKSYSVTNYDEYLKNAENLLEEVEKEGAFNNKAGIVRATILIKRHKNKEAENILKNIIEKDNHYINAYSTLGYLYISESRGNDAIELFKKGVSNDPENIEFMMSLADILIKQGRSSDGEVYLHKIIRLKPDVYSYKVALATLYIKNGEIGKAEQVLRDAVIMEDNAERNITLVNFLAQQQSMEKAIDELEKIIKRDQGDVGYKFVLSGLYVAVKKYDDSLSLLEEIEDTKKHTPFAIKAKIKQAEIYFAQNDMDKAEGILKDILKENGNNLDALFLKARIDINNNKLNDAINSLRIVVKEMPTHKEAPLLLAEALKKNGELDLAFSTMLQVLDAAPGNFQAYIDFTNFLLKNNDLKRALKIINKAEALFKSNFDILKQKFKLLVAINKPEEIIKLLDYMKSVLPSQYKVYQLSGLYFIKVGEYDRAIKNLKEALSKTNEPYFIYRDILKAYLLDKKIDQLYVFLRSEIKSGVRKVAALQTLGDLYFSDKKFEKSREVYIKILSIQSDWIYAYEGLIKLAVADKDYEKAISYFKSSIKVSAHKTEIQFRLIRFYVSLSKFAEADKLYEELVVDNPGNTMIINNYVAFLLDNMKSSKSISKARKLINEIKNYPNPSVQETIAWYYVNNKQYAESLVIYEKIIKEFTDSADVQYHYGYALFMNGEKQKAKPFLEAALKSDAKFVGKDKIKGLINQI